MADAALGDDLDLDEEAAHRQFLLTALRAASARARLMDADITTIGVALKGNMIDCETAVRWIMDAGLLSMVGALPERVGKLTGGGL